MLKIYFLGTGTSTGIPQIGCECEVCTSNDKKNKRLRSSVLVKYADINILIDCGPDIRQQLLTTGVQQLDAVLITHEHYDHVGGLDDLRPLGENHVFAEKRVLENIKQIMPYAFSDKPYPGVPKINLHCVSEKKEFKIGDLTIQPVRLFHAKLPVLGYRFGKAAYITDLKTISEESIESLRDLDVLVLNALRINQHISHISLDEAIILARKIGAKKTYFTHFSHDLGKHEVIEKLLPENMYLSYDNLEITV
mgnify:CR=1 FL=1